MNFTEKDIELEKQLSSNTKNPLPTNIFPKIYAYTEPQYKDIEWTGKPNRYGKGLIKVGDTKRNVYERVKEQFATNKPISEPFEILLEETALIEDVNHKTVKFFRDYDVHEVLEQSGIYRFPNSEWFECTVEEVKQAIAAVKQNEKTLQRNYLTFSIRPEQEQAVKDTSEYFMKYSKENEDGKIPHYLWNCKMRFGKTFTAYQLAKKMGWTKILILTFKPVVEDAWKNDLITHIDFKGWQFVSNNILTEHIDNNRPLVRFASFQDVLQKTEAGGIKPHNTDIDKTEWDCVIFDEYHFGAWRYKAQENIVDDTKELQERKQLEDEDGDKKIDYFDEAQMPLKTNAYLYLSGTPFRALNNGDFSEDQIFPWTYTDEQKAKKEWDYQKGENPYADLPQMMLMTYKMPKEISQIAEEGEYNEFDLNEFFSAKEENGHYIFKHEAEVTDWLNLIRGQYLPAKTTELKTGSRPPLPYSDVRLLNVLNHTYWYLPNVASCKAMGELLNNHPFYKDNYEIIVCAGKDAGIGYKALPPVREKIKNGISTKTITLSCGKLATGVTVPEWGGIFMLNNISTPETYFQAAFRVQSPWTIKNRNGLNPNEKHIIKNTCYVFDFAPNRALRQVSEYSTRLNLDADKSPEQKLEDFIGFLPVLCYNGSKMAQMDAGEIIDYVILGTSSSMLANKWQSANLINTKTDVLEKLLNNERAMNVLEKIESLANLRKGITTIINQTEKINKTKKEKQGKLTKEEKEELTEEQKEVKSIRKKIQEQLLQFAKKVPIFMYLTDEREQTLQDVIMQLHPELFYKVTGLTKEDFSLLVSIGVFEESEMNDAVLKFKRYEDDSLKYTGTGKHNESLIGAYNVKVSREEYTNIE